MVFNPYVVPGFPIFVFDAAATGQHFFAYVTDVRHELSPAGRYTQVNFSHVLLLSEYIELLARTIVEVPTIPYLFVQGTTEHKFAADVFNMSEEVSSEEMRNVFMANLIAAPLNPLMQYAVLSQTRAGANQYFNSLLWCNTRPSGGTIFDPLTSLNLVYKMQGRFVTESLDKVVNDLAFNPEMTIEKALDYTALQAAKHLMPAMTNYEEALRFVQRPVCTLAQYLTFKQAALPSGALKDDKGAAYPVKLTGAVTATSRRFWEGDTPEVNEHNHLIYPEKVSDLPLYVKNWSARLLQYRALVTKPQEVEEK